MVVDFADAAAQMDLLPAGRIPDMALPKPAPKVSVRPTPRQKVVGSQRKTVQVERDIEMEDVSVTGTRRVLARDSAGGTRPAHHAPGSKRGFEESPTAPAKVKKRARAAEIEDEELNDEDDSDEDEELVLEAQQSQLLDLSWLKVDEDSQISFKDFPPAKGQVRMIAFFVKVGSEIA